MIFISFNTIKRKRSVCIYKQFPIMWNIYFCYLSICLPRSLLIPFWPEYNKDSHHLTSITIENIFSQLVLCFYCYFYSWPSQVIFKTRFSDPLLSSLMLIMFCDSTKKGNKNDSGGDVTQEKTVSYPFKKKKTITDICKILSLVFKY